MFLHHWQQFGSYQQIADLQFKLIGKDNMISVLTLTQDEITIDGKVPSETFMLIDTLAKACEGDKPLEGEVIDKNQTQGFSDYFTSGPNNNVGSPFVMRQFGKITALSKTKIILVLIIAIPILIIMIPIAIVIMIIRIILFKLKFK